MQCELDRSLVMSRRLQQRATFPSLQEKKLLAPQLFDEHNNPISTKALLRGQRSEVYRIN